MTEERPFQQASSRHCIDFETIRRTPNCALLAATRYARLYRCDAWLLKYCMPQRFPKDYLRRYVGNSQAAREAFGYRHLRSLGLNTPAVVDYTAFLNPFREFESALAIEFLEAKAPVHVRLPLLPQKTREEIAGKIIRDIKTMLEAGVYFKDLHLGNILVGDDGVPFWIDPDISIIRNRRRLAAKASVPIVRMLRRNPHILGEQGMTALSNILR